DAEIGAVINLLNSLFAEESTEKMAPMAPALRYRQPHSSILNTERKLEHFLNGQVATQVVLHQPPRWVLAA
ncbi:hypothetical protein, partial [Bradyrhizobium sp.]|uniref:hypothetical protein n=1 Tax=Bradyrhizobium sp. TaxID=376 RepID=UPI00238ACD02